MRAHPTAALALATILVSGATRAGDGAAEAPEAVAPLRLAWIDVTGAAEGVDREARSEARSLLEAAGREVVWRRGGAGEEARRGEVRVILVERLLLERKTRRPILGVSPPRRRPYPMVWANVPSVQASLGLRPSVPPGDLSCRDRRDLGVALGRVVAHEIVHALAPALGHARDLMSERLTKWQLIASGLPLEPAAALAVREARPGEPIAPASAVSRLAVKGLGGGSREPGAR